LLIGQIRASMPLGGMVMKGWIGLDNSMRRSMQGNDAIDEVRKLTASTRA